MNSTRHTKAIAAIGANSMPIISKGQRAFGHTAGVLYICADEHILKTLCELDREAAERHQCDHKLYFAPLADVTGAEDKLTFTNASKDIVQAVSLCVLTEDFAPQRDAVDPHLFIFKKSCQHRDLQGKKHTLSLTFSW